MACCPCGGVVKCCGCPAGNPGTPIAMSVTGILDSGCPCSAFDLTGSMDVQSPALPCQWLFSHFIPPGVVFCGSPHQVEIDYRLACDPVHSQWLFTITATQPGGLGQIAKWIGALPVGSFNCASGATNTFTCALISGFGNCLGTATAVLVNP